MRRCRMKTETVTIMSGATAGSLWGGAKSSKKFYKLKKIIMKEKNNKDVSLGFFYFSLHTSANGVTVRESPCREGILHIFSLPRPRTYFFSNVLLIFGKNKIAEKSHQIKCKTS